jgi:hypothetical protein
METSNNNNGNSSAKSTKIRCDPRCFLIKAIRNWIHSQPVGYDIGPPERMDGSSNTKGRIRHTPAPENGAVYYNVLEQNCVWWATAMLVQNQIKIPDPVRTAIMEYNGGHGAAPTVLSGTRRGTTVHTMYDLRDEASLQTGRYSLDVASVGVGGLW